MASSRPLEQIRRDTKAANRSPHLRKKNFVGADPIDVLDNVGIGGAYHHGGPYDATLAQRNRDARYAPVAAVRETNMEALRATPYENVQDSLRKHVPLQGTASIPPGMRDFSGRRMDYEEGADLMREPDAPGGPYKRYEHVVSERSDTRHLLYHSRHPIHNPQRIHQSNPVVFTPNSLEQIVEKEHPSTRSSSKASTTSPNACLHAHTPPKNGQFWDWYKKSCTATMRGGKTLQEIQLARISDQLYQKSQIIRNKRMPPNGSITSSTTATTSSTAALVTTSDNSDMTASGSRDTRSGEHSSPHTSQNHYQYNQHTQQQQEPTANKRNYYKQQYHPDDLKGKGEPSFTIERDLKERKHATHRKALSTNGPSKHRYPTETNEYEMQPTTGYSTSSHAKNSGHLRVRNRSYSTGAESSRSNGLNDDDVGQRHRSGSTGKRLSEGFKRRFGNLRTKHGNDA